MQGPALMKCGLFVLGLVIGGGVVFGVVKITEKSSDDSADTTTTVRMTTATTGMTTTTARMTTTTSAPEANSTGTRAYDSLKFVVFVSRHGNRGAYNGADYPSDPYPLSNTTYWPYGAQELTTYGRLQTYRLGRKLRSLYNGFLPAVWSSSDIYPTSDKVTRVIFSGMMVLAGLYPPVGYQVWSEDLLWQPIIINTDSPDRSQDATSCKRIQTDKKSTWSTFETEDSTNISAIIDYIYEKTNKTYLATELFDLFEKFLSEELEGFPLPEWTQEIYPDPLEDFYGKAFVAKNSGTDTVSRLYVGEILDDVISIWGKVMNGTSSRLVNFYSGHDSTISNLQVALGVSRADMVRAVKPGSGLIVELHQNSTNSEYYIQTLFMDGTSADLEPMLLTLSRCSDPCYYDNFISSTVNFTSVSFSTECST